MLNPRSPEGHSAWDYAQTIVDELYRAVEAIENSQGNDPEFRRIPFNLPQADGTGSASQELVLPRGVGWTLVAIAFQASASGYVATYVNKEAGTTLLKVNQSSLIVSDSFDTDDQVTSDDGKLLIVTRGQVPGTVVSGNLRVRQFEMNPSNPRRAI